MKRSILGLVGLFFLLAGWVAPLQAQSSDTVVLEVDGVVSSGMEAYFERGIAQAAADGADSVVIVLDTPGGDVGAMLDIVKIIRSADVPVIVYVGPAGAQAASAGAVITLAGHAAVMAPETVIGAASPINGSGEDIPETQYNKLVEDLTATMRSLTERRGEEVMAVAEEMITDARAISSSEAIEIGLVDAIASDLEGALAEVDGLEVIVNGETMTLATSDTATIEVAPTILEKLQLALASSAVLGTLISVGTMAIIIELRAPGGYIAGLVGLVCLGLGLYGLGQIPANYFGLGLILLAFIMFIVETQTTTFGILSTLGVLTLAAGLWVLFNTVDGVEWARISLVSIAGIVTPTAGFFLYLVYKITQSQNSPVLTGKQALIGARAVSRKEFKPYGSQFAGTVLVMGELWRAVCSEQIADDTPVKIDSIDGFTVHVSPVEY